MAHNIDSRHRRPLAAVLGAVLLAAGCGESEQIRTYTIPKEPKIEVAAAPANPSATPPTAEAPAATPGEATDRMLTAVLPIDGQAWFFKVVGQIAVIEQNEKKLDEFFATIGVAADGKPTWKLPDGWKEGPAKPMRFATLLMPTDDKPLEVAISAASWSGTKESLVANVDRWRGQLKLPPTDADNVAKDIREIKAGEKTITVVDLRGRYTGGMMPPFAGGAGRPASPGAAPNLPPGHPPVETGQSTPPAASSQAPTPAAPKFTVPADWKQLPAGGMQVAALALGDANQKATVTIIPFSLNSGPSIADPLQNTNMWRSAVGLPPIKQDDLKKYTEAIEIEGKPAIYVRVVPDASEPTQSQIKKATLAAMAKSGDQIWFIKFNGDRDLVTAQEDTFKTFLKSLRFAADAGAPDGNK
jgi:hypothetical protein